MTDSNPSPVELTDEQRAIVETDEDTIVVSNPGTGKTTTLSAKVVKLLEDGVEPEDILCITFTTKAKKEMFDAIRLRSAGKFPVSDIMKIQIHTFHSFAYNYLVDSGLISGDIIGNNFLRFSVFESFLANQVLNYPKSYIIGTIMPKVENAIRYIKSYGITPDKIDLNAAKKQVSKLHNTMLGKQLGLPQKSRYSIEEMEAFLKYFVEAYQTYENSKTDKVDYSDMLLTFIEQFDGKKFPHVLVDEMQDMNEIEAQIVNKVSENLFLVGDAKQAIFGFQGGSIRNFEEFAKTCKLMLLATNMRSTQEILDYSKNYFLAGTLQRKKFEEELENFKSSANGSIPKIFQTDAPLSKILDLIDENQGKKIGIITRTNWQIVETSKFLDFNNIPYISTASQATSLNARNEIISFIKGLLSIRSEEKIAAAFTTFSPFTLKETFELSTAHKNKDKQKLKPIEDWKINLTREDLNKLFTEEIYPLCASKGPEWFSTSMLVNEQIEEYLTFETPTLDGLFDFIAIGEESYRDRAKESEITLTTVHKAKGLGFDIVIYIPSINDPKSGFIDTITTAIFASQGIDLKDEVAEESLRVDFVACTRAKEKLFIIGDEKSAPFFHVQDKSDFEVDPTPKEAQISSVVSQRLTEAYSLFVSGKLTESEELLKGEEPWLKEYIFSYFENTDHFSWSSVKTNSYEFLMSNIVKLPSISPALDYGNVVHKALQKILLGKAKPEDFPGDVQRAVKNGLSALEDLKKKFPGLQVVDTEVDVTVPLNSIVTYEHDDLLFTGKIDVLLKHDDGYLMIDWKTSASDSRASDYKRQLAVYKKMYSERESISEKEITTCVIFVAMRERINTGKFEQSIAIGDRNVFPTFEKHLQKVLGWKKDPNTFIEDILDPILHTETDELFLAIKEKLTTDLSGDPRWKQHKDGIWVYQ